MPDIGITPFQILLLESLYGERVNMKSKDIEELNFYLRKIQYQITRMSNLINKLQIGRSYLVQYHPLFKNKDGLKKTEKFLEEDYIRYHVENFYLRITSFGDILLELYNSVYNFDIKPSPGFKKQLLKKAEEIGVNDLTEILEKLISLESPLKSKRNDVAHRGYFHDDDLGMISGAEYFYRNKKELDVLSKGLQYPISELELIEYKKRAVMTNIMTMKDTETEMNVLFNFAQEILLKTLENKISEIKKTSI